MIGVEIAMPANQVGTTLRTLRAVEEFIATACVWLVSSTLHSTVPVSEEISVGDYCEWPRVKIHNPIVDAFYFVIG
jgi:hypothetical protein